MANRRTKEPPAVRCEVIELPREMWSQLLGLHPAFSGVAPVDGWSVQWRTWVPICLSAISAELTKNRNDRVRIRGAVLAWHWVSEWLLAIAWSPKMHQLQRQIAAWIGGQIVVTIAPYFAIESFAAEVP